MREVALQAAGLQGAFDLASALRKCVATLVVDACRCPMVQWQEHGWSRRPPVPQPQREPLIPGLSFDRCPNRLAINPDSCRAVLGRRTA